MSAVGSLNDLFAKGGLNYRPVPDVIDLLPRPLQHAASVVYRALMRILKRKELDQRATDKVIAEECGWSESFVQKGLHALDVDLAALGAKPAIERKSGIGCHGRRTITPTLLAGSKDPAETSSGPSPVDSAHTTTEAASSSSPSGPDGEEKKATATAPPELIARACALVEKATPGRVIDAVAVYSAEWTARALDVIEARNRQQGTKRVRSWGFVLGILRNWQQEGGPPPPDQKPTAAPTPAPSRSAEDPTAAAEAEQTSRLKAKWDALTEPQRQEIRAKVTDENPQLRRWPNLLEPLYLAELERRE